MKQKKAVGILFYIGILSIIFTGCGNDSSKQTVSDVAATGAAVSGTAVSGSSLQISEEKGNASYLYANETNVYLEESSDYEEAYKPIGIAQYTRDGKLGAKVRIKNLDTLLAVTEDSVYYSRNNFLCRIPLKKGKDGKDVLELEQQQEILQEKHSFLEDHAMYVDPDYFVYITYDRKEVVSRIVLYDRKKRKQTVIRTDHNSRTEIVYRGDGFLILRNEYQGFSLLTPHTGKLETMGTLNAPNDPDVGAGCLAMAGDMESLFYQWRKGKEDVEEIRRFDIRTGKMESLFTSADLRRVCQRIPLEIAENPELSHFYITGMFYSGRRIYIQVQAAWKKGKKEWDRYTILSADAVKQNPELIYEKELTACLWENSEEAECALRKEEDCDFFHWNSGRCHMMQEGKAILILHKDGKSRQRLGCYDLERRSFEWQDQRKREFYFPYYDSKKPFGDGSYTLELGSWMAYMPSELLS